MQLDPSYLVGIGHYHPPTVLDNNFFDQLDIESSAQWIQERTGIKTRRSVLSPEDIIRLKTKEASLEQLREEGRVPSIADISERAWNHLQTRVSNINPELVLCGSSVPDFDIPANACSIAARLKMQVAAFDVNSACSSFVINMHTARSLLANDSTNTIAVFNPERYSLRMDFSDKSSCVLFGDGCAASLLSKTAVPGSLKVIDTFIESDPSGYDLVRINDGKNFWQNGRAVQKFAITRTIEASLKILEKNSLEPTDISYFTGHQANLRMISSAAEKLGFSSEKHLFNVDEFGNQGAAGAPSVLSQNWDLFKTGDKILVAVVGSGLTWGSILLEKI